jgi:hypothetical protein
MQITPEEIIVQARTWLGTPFHHQGRVKHVGVDCIGLIVCVIDELGLSDKNGQCLSNYDATGYSRTPDGFTLKNKLDTHLQPVPIEEIAPGDILLFRFHKNPQHVAFVTDRNDGDFSILHCYSTSNYVVEHRLDDKWKKLIVAAYRIKLT